MATQISKKRKFVADGVFRAELNDFFSRELSEEGYAGCDVRVTHARTEVRFNACVVCSVLILGFRSSFVLPSPRKFWVRRVAASGS